MEAEAGGDFESHFTGEAGRRLASSRIAIAGLGLMGGSLALALHGRCQALLGIDNDPAALALARAAAVFEAVSADPAQILPGADVVVLAAPVRAILQLLRVLPELHEGPAVVLDLGSTKVQVCAAMAALPGRFDPLGGHPMCGKETRSLANAEAGLFQGATFVLAPLERTSALALGLAEALVRAVGARPLRLDPATHDRWAAATSHLPYLLSAALAAATPSDSRPLIGPGYRSMTRLAHTSPEMMGDVLATNQANVLEALRRLQDRLAQVEALLAQGQWEDLKALLGSGVLV
jgi:prephenate dehydrogenase